MTINPGDWIRDKTWALNVGRVVSLVTHKLGPGFVIELANGQQSFVFEDEAVLLGYADCRPPERT